MDRGSCSILLNFMRGDLTKRKTGRQATQLKQNHMLLMSSCHIDLHGIKVLVIFSECIDILLPKGMLKSFS